MEALAFVSATFPAMVPPVEMLEGALCALLPISAEGGEQCQAQYWLLISSLPAPVRAADPCPVSLAIKPVFPAVLLFLPPFQML